MSAFVTPNNSPPTLTTPPTITYRLGEGYRAFCVVREPPVGDRPARWGLAVSRFPAAGSEQDASRLPNHDEHKWQVYQWHFDQLMAIYRPADRFYDRNITPEEITAGDVTGDGVQPPEDVTTRVIKEEWKAEIYPGPKHLADREHRFQISEIDWSGDDNHDGIEEEVIHAALLSGDNDRLEHDYDFIKDIFDRMRDVENGNGQPYLPYGNDQFHEWWEGLASNFEETKALRTGNIVVQGEYLPGQGPSGFVVS